MKMTVGVVIPTLNPGPAQIASLLKKVRDSDAVDRVLMVDSGSTDGTTRVAAQYDASVRVINKGAFNHGATRELARKAIGTDIVVMMTQDAMLVDSAGIGALIKPIVSGAADVSYGRQLPRPGADIFEAFPREFNYPAASCVKTIMDIEKFGVFTFFCSNSFAAYANAALDRVGGFESVLTNEDYFAVARILKNGGRVAYVAEAEVVHSHKYTIVEEYRRYFDTGFVRGERRWVQQMVGNAETRGARMTRELLLRLVETRPMLIPYGVALSAAKWLGYRCGYHSVSAPVWWKRAMSGQKYFWNSEYNVQCRKT